MNGYDGSGGSRVFGLTISHESVPDTDPTDGTADVEKSTGDPPIPSNMGSPVTDTISSMMTSHILGG